MVWNDQLLLPAMIIAPLLGALFLIFIPPYEIILRKKVSLFVVMGIMAIEARLAFLLFNTKSVSLDLGFIRPLFINEAFELRFDFFACAALLFLLLTTLLLFYCPLSKASQSDAGLYSKTLFVISLSTLSILASNFGFVLLCQLLIIHFLLIFNLRGNGSHRGSSALTTAVFFTLIDLSAFILWSWQREVAGWLHFETLAILILLPAISRLTVPFFSPWARGLFANSSAEITILFFITSFIAGTNALVRFHIESPFLSTVASFSGLFGALLSISDKPLSHFLIRMVSIAGSLTLFAATLSQRTDFATILYALSSVLVISISLLLQRAMVEDETHRARTFLFPLWLTTIALSVTLPWTIFPIQSPLWVVNYCILAFAVCLRVRTPLTQSNPTMVAISSRLSVLDVVNTWVLSCILMAMILAVQFLIWNLELTL